MEVSNQIAINEKSEGNSEFQKKNYKTALEHYEKALQIAKATDFSLRNKLCSNISLCHFHLQNFKEALTYINICIDYMPKLPKSDQKLKTYCRKATILSKLKLFNDALKTLNEASIHFNSEEDRKIIEKLLVNISKYLNRQETKQISKPDTQYQLFLEKIQNLVSITATHEQHSKLFEQLYRPLSFRKLVYGDYDNYPSYLPNSLQDFFKNANFREFQEAVIPKIIERYETGYKNIEQRGKDNNEEITAEMRPSIERRILKECVAVITNSFLKSISSHFLLETLKDESTLAILGTENPEISLDQLSSVSPFFTTDQYFITEQSFLNDTHNYWQDLLRNEIYQAFNAASTATRKNNTHSLLLQLSSTENKQNFQGLVEMLTNFKSLPYELNKKSNNSMKLCKLKSEMLLLRVIQAEESVLSSDEAYESELSEISTNEEFFDSGFNERDTGIKVSVIYFVNSSETEITLRFRTKEGQIQEETVKNDTLVLYKSRFVSFNVKKVVFHGEYKPVMMISGFFYGVE